MFVIYYHCSRTEFWLDVKLNVFKIDWLSLDDLIFEPPFFQIWFRLYKRDHRKVGTGNWRCTWERNGKQITNPKNIMTTPYLNCSLVRLCKQIVHTRLQFTCIYCRSPEGKTALYVALLFCGTIVKIKIYKLYVHYS